MTKHESRMKDKPDVSPNNVEKQRSRYIRLREIEELYINGYSATEIFNLVGEKYSVTQGTIRNDIVSIRKRWKGELEPEHIKDAKDQYLASLKSMRRKALSGWREATITGDKVRGRDYKLAFEIDKEVARITGVELRSDSKTIHLSMEKARGYLEKIMSIVWLHVTDDELRSKIMADLELIDDQE